MDTRGNSLISTIRANCNSRLIGLLGLRCCSRLPLRQPYAVLSYSQSTDPASAYYADQTREFSNKKLHRHPFTAAEIAADLVAEPLTLRE
jgi:acyl-homoserine lactone acylase PvdQ